MTSSPPSSRLAAAVPPESPASPDGNRRKGLRSLWHLSRHLTARADDNHAAPTCMPEGRRRLCLPSCTFQARVRFLAYHRIKPHVPPLVRAPVNSFEFHRSGGLTRKGQIPSVHRLPRGLPGYLILFDTRAFEHERRSRAGRLPSRSEFFVISMHFTATPRVPPSLPATKGSSSRRCTGLSPALSRHACTSACAPFKPNKSG